MTQKIEIEPGVEAEIASKEEALWIKARDATMARIKSVKESLTVDEAFLELCEQKIRACGV